MGLNLFNIVLWWLVLEIIGFVALPIASHVGRNLRDNGYSLSKPLGLLLLTFIVWILTLSGFRYSSNLVFISLGIIALCSLFVFLKNGFPTIDKKYIIKFEILFFIAFLLFSVIRAYSPEIYWTGGEKFMDISFINMLMNTGSFPPVDPWMSGTDVQYYYFGYLIVVNLIKITGILPSIAFNLATPSFFALSLTTAFGIGYNLTGKIRSGIVTAFMVTIAGNLVGFFQILDIISKGDVINGIQSFNYWTASRVIPNTINEFPFFSFLHGDVHAHMISITFQLLVILLLLNFLKSKDSDWIMVLVLGLAIGFLYPLNTWDYPVYLFLSFLVVAFNFIHSRKFSFRDITVKNLLKPLSVMTGIAISSYILYLPYHLSNKLDRTISLVPTGRTELAYYLAVFGLFLYIIYSFILVKSGKSKIGPYNVLLLSFLFVISIAFKFQLLILLIPLIILSACFLIKELDKDNAFVLILILTGSLLSLFCELFYIGDALGNANPTNIRLNTVFKLYIQNWIMWGVASGVIISNLSRFGAVLQKKKAWNIIAIILVLMVSIYPVFATIGKSGGFSGEPTLDGEAYVKQQHPQEYEAIRWFGNVEGQPVVLQTPGNVYQWNTYITAFTGLPTVMGWGGHEITWRQDSTEVNRRWSDVNRIYTSQDTDEVVALLDKYDVTYIYFGEAEAKRYGTAVLFDSHPEIFNVAFEYGDVIVYRINQNRPNR